MNSAFRPSRPNASSRWASSSVFVGERTELRYVGTWEFAPDSALSFGLERSEERFHLRHSIGDASSARST